MNNLALAAARDFTHEMTLSYDGLELIKDSEGLVLSAYKCPADVWTIGYGHTNGVRRGDKIDEATANMFLTKDVGWAERSVAELVRVPLEQYQFDALASFVINLGRGGLKKSTLLRLLNKGDYDGAAKQFPRWNKHRKGKRLVVSRGLTIRRNAEMMLFMGHGVTAIANDNEVIPQRVEVPMGKGVGKTLLTSKTIKGVVGLTGGSCFGLNEVLAKGQQAATQLSEIKQTVGAFDFLGDNLPVLLMGVAVGVGLFLIYNRIRDMQKGLAS